MVAEQERKVHPAAAVFPMLADDELADLAEDIKANGLLHLIVLDAEGQIIDGRNRHKACLIAGVEPRFETFDGDPLVYIISANINRRDMRPGQKAMALADLLSTFGKCQKYGQHGGIAKAGGVDPSDLSRSLTVREHVDLAAQVRSGASLRDAHKGAVERKRRQKEQEESAEKHLAYVEEQHQKAVAKLEAARAAMGPAIKVPPEPDMAVTFSHQPEGDVKLPHDERGLGENLDREASLLTRLGAIKADVARVASEDIIEDAWFFEGHVLAVRSWASQVVALVYDMVEAHNAALHDEGRLRRVK